MIRAILASLIAGFAVAAIVFFAGQENTGPAIISGLLVTVGAGLGLWLRERRHQAPPPEEVEPPSPNFDAVLAWGTDEHGPVLEIVIRNVGTKQGAIQGAYIRTPQPDPEVPWHEWEIGPLQEVFSVVLDTDQVTAPVLVELGHAPPEMEKDLKALVEGEAELVIVSTRGEEHLPIPAIGQGPPPPTLEELLD